MSDVCIERGQSVKVSPLSTTLRLQTILSILFKTVFSTCDTFPYKVITATC